jgi:hypothetical protein
MLPRGRIWNAHARSALGELAQALVGFLKNQFVERDGREHRFRHAGYFGHGNVAGIGQALQEHFDFRYIPTCNEQSSVYWRRGSPRPVIACAPSSAPGRSDPAQRIGSPERRSPPSTGCRLSCCRATFSRAATSRACAAAVGIGLYAGGRGQRLFQARQPLLGPHLSPGADHHRATGGRVRSRQRPIAAADDDTLVMFIAGSEQRLARATVGRVSVKRPGRRLRHTLMGLAISAAGA